MDEIGRKPLDGCFDLPTTVADPGVVVCYDLGAFGHEGVYQDRVPLV